jgi:hypothetical protein
MRQFLRHKTDVLWRRNCCVCVIFFLPLNIYSPPTFGYTTCITFIFKLNSFLLNESNAELIELARRPAARKQLISSASPIMVLLHFFGTANRKASDGALLILRKTGQVFSLVTIVWLGISTFSSFFSLVHKQASIYRMAF